MIGEFELIDKISRRKVSPHVVMGIGDDTAVLETDSSLYQLFTTDSLVEGDHFKIEWSRPYQVGVKAIEQNVSDIAAMGGYPTYALVSLCIPKGIEDKEIEELYHGLRETGNKYHMEIVGGNITHGEQLIITISLLGLVERERLCLRSGANPGDFIMVTGTLGKSSCLLELLRSGKKHYEDLKEHLEPKCQLALGRELSSMGVNSMIDVSDGLASEIRHICSRSKVGAEIYREKIPLSDKTIRVGRILDKDPYDFALYGGEDFELVFTVPANSMERYIDFGTVVGRIVAGGKVRLLSEGVEIGLKKGFDHFKK